MRNLSVITGLPFNAEIIDITDKLPRRMTWEELPDKQNIVRGVWDGTYHTGFRNPEDIDTIAIHHSGSPEGTLISHAKYHASQWGAGISYHMSIEDGVIKQTNDLRSFTFHVAGNNTYTVGIEINRDLSKSDLTDRERQLLYAAILTVKSMLPIKQILGHNELNKTACPCTSMSRIRDDVAKLELQMKAPTEPTGQRQLMYKAANQHRYLYNEYQADPVKNKWMEPWLLDLHKMMDERNMYFER